MAQQRKGTVKRLSDGRWKIGIRAPGRPRVYELKPATWSEKRARTYAANETERAEKLATELPRPSRPKSGGETVADYAARWVLERERRGLRSARDDRARLRDWVLPVIGAEPIASVDAEAIRDWVEWLDGVVLEGKIRAKTAWNVWGVARKMFVDSARSKTKALRVRSGNPTADVEGPDRGAERSGTYLYPEEFLELVQCEAVPLDWRRAITLAVYLAPRAGELRALTWDDLDLERGIVHIHHSEDREGQGLPTKTKMARRFALEKPLVPYLRALRAEGDGLGKVLRLPDDRHLARGMRGVLQEAGLDRPDLYADDATRRPLTWHDLRGTSLTWMAVRGDDPLKIQQRAGHTTFATTQGYIREAESVREGFGQVFPPLPTHGHWILLDPDSATGPESQWTRMQPIRTTAQLTLEVVVFSSEPFRYQQIAGEARRMRKLGMSLRAIGRTLGVDGKTVARALRATPARPRGPLRKG